MSPRFKLQQSKKYYNKGAGFPPSAKAQGFHPVDTMKSSSVVKNYDLETLLPHTCSTYREALELAFQKIAQNEVVSSWMDAWEIKGENPNLNDYLQVPEEGCLKDRRIVPIKDSKQETLERIWRLGGAKGYYTLDTAWRLRGLIDQMIGGVGLNRGRRHPSQIQAGDSIDFWRVIRADKESGCLILYAEMKLPGEAWLDFKVEDNHLIQTATFRPKGVLGRLYWYLLVPFHFIIFRRMARSLAGQISTQNQN